MNVNKAILIGRLGKDVEVRYAANGDAVANFNVATSKKWKDCNNMPQERTEWHNVVAFKRLGEICWQYLKKGALVYIEGEITTRKWQDKSGNDRYTTEIICAEMKMLGGKDDGERNSAPRAQPAKSAPADDFDDDIPF